MLSYVTCLPFREFLLYFHKVKVEFNRMGGIRLDEKLQSNCLVYSIDSCIKEKVERLQPYKYFTKIFYKIKAVVRGKSFFSIWDFSSLLLFPKHSTEAVFTQLHILLVSVLFFHQSFPMFILLFWWYNFKPCFKSVRLCNQNTQSRFGKIGQIIKEVLKKITENKIKKHSTSAYIRFSFWGRWSILTNTAK